jgi:hypothetical protein
MVLPRPQTRQIAGKRELIVPKRVLAAAVAEEWMSRKENRPATMPRTRLATTAIDRVATQREAIIEETATTPALTCLLSGGAPAGAGCPPAGGPAALIDWAALRYAPLAI